MSTIRRQKPFGPLLYGVLALACFVLVGLVLQGLWPSWREYRELRSLAGELRSSSVLVHRHAADELVRAGSPGVPWLVEAAGDRDGGVRLLAYTVLRRTVSVPGPAIPTLVKGLQDPDARIRREAADALARFGPEAIAAADGLTRAMRDDEPDIRLRAARALSKMGGRAGEPALGVLLALISDPDAAHNPDRTVMVPVIRRMGPSAETRAIAVLIRMIDAEGPPTRRAAIECLGQFGPSARAAIPKLEGALQDEDRVARCLAALALSEIEGWESGRARWMLEELAGSPSLPANVEKQVQWVLTTDLVAGSEVWQPVHTLRGVVGELRRLEAGKAVAASGSVDVEEMPADRMGPTLPKRIP